MARKTKESVSFVKVLPQIILRNVSRGLSKDGFAGSGIKLLMVGNRQRLFFTRSRNSSQFDMAASLRKLGKSKIPQNINNVSSGHPT